MRIDRYAHRIANIVRVPLCFIDLLVWRRFGHVGVPLGAEVVAGRLPVLGVAPRHLQQGLLVLLVAGRHRRRGRVRCGHRGHRGRRGRRGGGRRRRGPSVDRAGRPPGPDVPSFAGPRTPVPTTPLPLLHCAADGRGVFETRFR